MCDELIDFGYRVRVLREQRQLTLEKLSGLTGIDPSHLGLIERGKRNLKLTTIIKIARGLNISMQNLFEEVI